MKHWLQPSQFLSTDMNRYQLLERRKIYSSTTQPTALNRYEQILAFGMEENILPSVYTHIFISLSLPSFPPSHSSIFLIPMFDSSFSSDAMSAAFSSPDGNPCRHQLIPVVVVFLLRFHLVAIYLILWNKFLLTICTCSDIWQPNMGFNMPSNRHILQNATHTDLVSSGNAVFHKICVTNIKLEAELKGLRYIH